jgi:ATP-dependent Clp protease adaptor protein ClpS
LAARHDVAKMVCMREAPSTFAVPETIEDQETGAANGLDARVVVYNCNCHTYQQVITLFCQAIPGMNPNKAFELAYRIDHQGSAVVYQGELKIAEEIAKKLADGGLRVAVQ